MGGNSDVQLLLAAPGAGSAVEDCDGTAH